MTAERACCPLVGRGRCHRRRRCPTLRRRWTAGLRGATRRCQGQGADRRGRGQRRHGAAFSVDARQEAAVQNLFAKIEREVEVCLYNAGSNVSTPLLETTEKLFRQVLELACYGGFLVGREAARHMVPRGHGTILLRAPPRACAAARALPPSRLQNSACVRWRKSMARELGRENIHVAHLLIDAGVDSEAIRKRMRARIRRSRSTRPFQPTP